MKSKHRSLFFGHLLLCLCLGCTAFSNSGNEQSRKILPTSSLQSDRSHLDKMRENIPAEIQETNDGQAYILSFFSDRSLAPSQVQARFQKDTVKKRNQFNSYLKKERDEFYKKNKAAVDRFLDGLKTERESFIRSKPSTEERKAFFDQQDQKRKDFFADQKDVKAEFTHQQKILRDDFNQKSKDLRAVFNDELKLYRLEHKQQEDLRQRKNALRKRALHTNPNTLKGNLEDFSPEVQAIIKDLDRMYKTEPEPL